MSPLNRRRLAAFRSSRRGMISLAIFGLLFLVAWLAIGLPWLLLIQ